MGTGASAGVSAVIQEAAPEDLKQVLGQLSDEDRGKICCALTNMAKPAAASSQEDALDKFNNICMLTDSYKVTHHLQYPPGTKTVYSYFECRGGAYEEVCFFGLQYFLKRYLVGQVVTKEKIDAAEEYVRIHLSHPVWGYDEKLFNREGWEYILKQHNGHLPIKISAVPEGTVVTYKNVLFTMENTDEKCFWLTNYLETLLVQAWYPTTVCTQSREQKKIINKWLRDTGSEDVIEKGLHLFKLHDFGFRGVSSVESAATGGAGHLVNFLGTDTMAALVMAKQYYGEDFAGFSIPASEHSTMTSWGREKEVDAMRNMLERYPKGIVACVSDSYDVFKACSEYWGTELKSLIENRDGFLVVRPDSGELPQIVLDVLTKLEEKFGSTKTKTGHKLLPPCIRMIQGDGIDINSLDMILKAMADAGWAADNAAFGSGGALLQKLHRDTQKCAFKCSYARVGDEDRDVVKDPITDPGKKSKKGKLTLECDDKGVWTTVTEGKGDPSKNRLVEVFRDGKLLVDDCLAAIRKRSNQEFVPVESVPKPLPAPGIDVFNNIVLLTDSYKVTHHLQYPPGTKIVYSYFECRGGLYSDVCFFGLQYFLKKYLCGPVVTKAKIDAAEAYFKIHFSHPVWGYNENLFNREAWEYILKEHNGHLPVKIKAVPEGTVVNYKNVLFTMENTDEKCFWLTNYLETLLVQLWYPTTVCTQSREQLKIINKWLRDTGSEDVIEQGLNKFKLHDFGFRGVSSVESAATGGAGHLVNFLGTDTMAAIVLAKQYYGESYSGFSIPASEHSTMTSWGREGEVEAMRNMLTQYPKGIVACVSDSYDVFKACSEYWGTELKSLIEKRDGFLVVRPDSGELPKIVLDVLAKLEEKFGSTKTKTGHKLLPPCIRMIQGDGVDINSLEMILKAMADAGWAADNAAFGSGGALLQKLHRDTQKCAFKCSYARIGDEDRDVVKDPITDPGKKSKKGKLTLENNDGVWTTVTEGKGDPSKDRLVEVFNNGKLLVDDTFATIRGRAVL
jgi:nicotinamide phosphoribosyltransferase